MSGLHDPISLLQAVMKENESSYVEEDVFATDNAVEIVRIIDGFCQAQLGSRLEGYLFYFSRVGSVHGVKLCDGRDVVLKVRPPASANPDLRHDRKSMETICAAQRWLYDGGYPCPKLLCGPEPVGNGFATVEEFFEKGEHGDGFQPACRKTIAAGLAELINLLRSYPGDVSCLDYFKRHDKLYPQPHDKIFNFERTTKGAEWIDDFARRARALEIDDGTRVLGHADWRVEHLRFQDGRIVAVYDWDSLALRTETELVGVSAQHFTADWSLPDMPRIQTGNDIRAYIYAYEDARGQKFSKRERLSVLASCVYGMAYGARCAHSYAPNDTGWQKSSALRTEGESLLAEAAR